MGLLEKLKKQARDSVKADQILHALERRHTNRNNADYFLTQVKNGPTSIARAGHLRIIDGLAIRKSWTQPCITAYEVKVSRSDFLGDTKWMDYLPLSNELYFACPAQLIQPEEVGEEVGLVWYYPERKTLVTKKKAVYRAIEMPTNLLYYVIMNRLDNERHPFFSDQREYLEAWLENKMDTKRLAWRVKSKLLEDNKALLEQIKELEDKVVEADRRVKGVEMVRQVLEAHGFDCRGLYTSWGWRSVCKHLEGILDSGNEPELVETMRYIHQRASEAVKRLEAKEVRP